MSLERLYHRIKPALSLYWDIAATGELSFFGDAKPAILAPNHSCFLDPYLVSAVSPRPIRWLITRNWAEKSTFWRWYFKAHDTLPVEPEAGETIKKVCENLERGQLIGVFPEGRISHDNRLQRFFPGIANMAAQSGVRVIPVGICGAFESLPRTRRFPKPGLIRINFGEPRLFQCTQNPPAPRSSEIREFTDRLRQDIAALIGQHHPQSGQSLQLG